LSLTSALPVRASALHRRGSHCLRMTELHSSKKLHTSRLRGRRLMAGSGPRSFNSFTCPSCQALYHLVKVEAGPETVDHALTCLACGAPLPNRESAPRTLCLNMRTLMARSGQSSSRATMSIDLPYWPGHSIPRQFREMSLALENVCNGLGPAPPEDQAVRRSVAQKIIELAGRGMLGATLNAMTVKAVEAERRKG
jgi:hypothetical protein